MPASLTAREGAPPALTAETAQLAVEYSSDAIFTLDAAGIVCSANPAVSAELHYAGGQLLGSAWIDSLDPGSRAKGLALLREGAQAPTTMYELNQFTATGAVVLIGYRAIPLPVETAAPDHAPRVLLIGRLLSSTIAATERLVALNQRLSTLFAMAAVAARSLLLPDMLSEVLRLLLSDADAQAGAVLLADAPIAIASDQDAVLDWQGTFHLAAQRGLAPALAARLPEWPELMRERFSRTEPFVIAGSDAELDANRFELLASASPLLTMMVAPIRNERQLLGWLCVISDRYQAFGADIRGVTSSIGALLGPPIENARLYSELLETSGQLGAVLDNIDSGVLLIDSAGIIRYANRRLGTLLETDVSAWPGQPRAERLGQLLAPVDEIGPLFDDPLLATTGVQRRILRRFTDQIADSAGEPVGIIEVYNDVTQIHQIDRLKDEFIAAAAHDLKTPVTAVKGYTQIALRLAQRTNAQSLMQPLEMINMCSNNLGYLMDTLLDMSRLQAGRLRIDIEPFALHELVARAVRHFTFETQHQRHSVVLEQPGTPITVEWDAPRIERVLINLIGNALKYSPDGGAVTLRVRDLADQDAIELTVTDHGIGIPVAEREQVFERFYRVRQAVADGFRGSGLGLYICRSVVAAHGGRIWVGDALHGGAGTTVFVVLPRATAIDVAEGS